MKKCLYVLMLFCLLVGLCACVSTPEAPVDTTGDTGMTTEADTSSEGSVSETETIPENVTEAATEAATEVATEAATEAITEEETTNYFDANRIELVEPDTSKVIDLTLVDEGYDIYQLPSSGNGGWRYGPSYIYYGDGRVDAYFASGGDSGEWDRITHRSSTDDGKTWSAEKIVVYPTPDSMDDHSCCDPGAVYFNGYYYVGYTSTLNDNGYCNNIFVARSKNPDGPFEKWNGEGWGGAPAPIVYFEQSYGYWGIGEPSFIELNGTLYIYYTYATPMRSYFMLATADATNENWPATMEFHGAVLEKKSDSMDVKYVEDWGKFIGVTREEYDSAGSWIAIYESVDGKSFTLADAIRENTCPGMFAMGLSSRPNGHINTAEDAEHLRISYAYGNLGWAAWNTRIHAITMTQTENNDLDAERAKDALDVPVTREEAPVGWEEWTMLRTEKDYYILSLEQQNELVKLFLRDRYVNGKNVSSRDKNITFSDYDETVLSFKGLVMIPLAVGETTVTAHYGNLTHEFRVKIVTTNADREAICAETTIRPVSTEYVIYLGERSIYRPQLRVRITKGDGSVSEMYVNDGPSELTFTDYDENVIAVSDKGVVTARSEGNTIVTIQYGTKTMKVRVKVTNDPADALFGVGDVEEMSYVSLDLTKELDRTALSHFANCEMTPVDEGVKVTVNSAKTDPALTDPSFKVVYQGALEPVMTEKYNAVEITYKVSTENSPNTTSMCIYIGAGAVMDAWSGYSTHANLISDGEFHTLTIPVDQLDYWKDQLNVIRFDFFDAALSGDSMIISSIKLVEKTPEA